ncbi:glycine cleavage system protein H, partial [Pseudomonas aeruginosa]
MSTNLHGPVFPDGLCYAPDYNLWLREEVDGILTLGVSAYCCALYIELVGFTPKRDGWHIERDR